MLLVKGFGCSWGWRKRTGVCVCGGEQAGAEEGADAGREYGEGQGRLGPEKASAPGLRRASLRKQSKITGHTEQCVRYV